MTQTHVLFAVQYFGAVYIILALAQSMVKCSRIVFLVQVLYINVVLVSILQNIISRTETKLFRCLATVTIGREAFHWGFIMLAFIALKLYSNDIENVICCHSI